MSIDLAANDLLSQLHAPRGMVNVLPITDGKGEHLLVWVDTQYMRILKTIPDTFEGYPVMVAPRPQAIAYHH